jgi:hypothetical protein
LIAALRFNLKTIFFVLAPLWPGVYSHIYAQCKSMDWYFIMRLPNWYSDLSHHLQDLMSVSSEQKSFHSLENSLWDRKPSLMHSFFSHRRAQPIVKSIAAMPLRSIFIQWKIYVLAVNISKNILLSEFDDLQRYQIMFQMSFFKFKTEIKIINLLAPISAFSTTRARCIV